ncbi:SDR family oxidoreductase [Actinoallomurus bryophytorum]|uniref:Putative NADH-flavin reductase n=1 Tax=Actinoallomurus bryophytorum TaxID=1490222 RepID=A0A543CUJ6_9ACTN|nr:NAD(P)H-binding protein [Actinoallomurus bryophytorum]TQM00731.1 putative NADH-flavin reductase [Actinoallomurus bryophytorum]
MRIVVLGSTGATGRQVLTVALERGHEVVALARRPDALSGVTHGNLQVRQADVHDPETVTSACREADAVISALGMTRGAPAGTLSAGARAIADAKPSRVAWMGSLGAGDSLHRAGSLYDFILRRVLGHGFADKAVADEAVAGPRSTVFHPVMLTDGPATGKPRVVPLDFLDRSWRLMPPKVARADVATAMVTEIENPAHAGRTVVVF